MDLYAHLDGEETSSSSPGPGVPPFRLRLLTEDTVLHSSSRSRLHTGEQSEHSPLTMSPSDEGEESLLSSLTDHSRPRRGNSYYKEKSTLPLPKEIFLPCQVVVKPIESRARSLPPRPEMGNCRSRGIIQSNTIVSGQGPPSTISEENSSLALYEKDTTTEGDTVLTPEERSLLGTRPRRIHRRVTSATISVGSIVGHSSLNTTPTVAASSLPPMMSSSTYSASSLSLCAKQRPRNVVKEEIKYVLRRVSSPIRRRLCLTENPSVDFQRSHGTLT